MITYLNDMQIKHNGFKVLYVRSVKTGKFLKHSLAMNAMFKDFISNFLALFSCGVSLMLFSIISLCGVI